MRVDTDVPSVANGLVSGLMMVELSRWKLTTSSLFKANKDGICGWTETICKHCALTATTKSIIAFSDAQTRGVVKKVFSVRGTTAARGSACKKRPKFANLVGKHSEKGGMAVARPRSFVEVQEAKRRIHRSKDEIEERRASQVSSEFSGLVEPPGLTKSEQQSFWKWAEILDRLGILSDLDVEALGRYVRAQNRYLKAEKILGKVLSSKDSTLNDIEQAQRIQDRALKAVTACAKCLGMTIDSRARLVAPKSPEETKTNRFLELDA